LFNFITQRAIISREGRGTRFAGRGFAGGRGDLVPVYGCPGSGTTFL